jgi:cytidine deaminase
MKFLNAGMNRRTALMTIASSGIALMPRRPRILQGVVPDKKGASKSLSAFNERSRQVLHAVVSSPEFTGQIPASRVQEIANSEGKDVATLMLGLLPLASSYSRPPISNYRVGTVASGVSGSLYLGMNIEVPGQSLGFSVHGEQAALSNAYMHGETGVSAIAVTAAPCGHCRQFMEEVSPDGKIQILVEGKNTVALSLLLPAAFGPKDLGFRDGAFPPRETKLAVPSGSADELTNAALEAAKHSYAPYSQAYAGIAIGTNKGQSCRGSYLENAAFNPSLSPLQTALVQLILAGHDYAAISRVVLVEIRNAKISQSSVTKAVLNSIAPGVELQTIAATNS